MPSFFLFLRLCRCTRALYSFRQRRAGNVRKPVPIALNNHFVSLLNPQGIDTGFVHLALFADGTIICVRW